MKLGPDLDWLVQADVDPVKFLLDYGDRIVFLHLRDQTAGQDLGGSHGRGRHGLRGDSQCSEKIRFSGDAVIELAHPARLQTHAAAAREPEDQPAIRAGTNWGIRPVVRVGCKFRLFLAAAFRS